MRKRFISFGIVSILIVALLAGCGTNGNKENTPASAGSVASTTPTEGASAEPVEPVTLTIIDWYSKNELTPAIEAWNKANPDIQLKEEIIDGNSWQTIYTTRFQSGDAPDLLFMDRGETPQWAENGYLMDVTDRPSIQDLKENLPELYNAREINGKVYLSVVDSGASTNMIFYNQVIFDKLNLSVPTTMEEFYQVCEAIKASGVDPLVFGAGDWAGYRLLANPFRDVTVNNQGIKNAVNALVEGTATIPQIYESTFTMLKKLSDGGYVSKASATLKYDQSVQYFADGRAAMLPQGNWVPTLEAITKADPAKFKLNSFMLPYPADSNKKINMTVSPGYGLAINAKTKYPEQAKKAFDGLTSIDSIKMMVQGMGATTIHPGIKLELDPALQQSNDQLYAPNVNKVIGDPDKYEVPASFGDVYKKAMFDAINSGVTVEKSLKDLQTEWDIVKESVKKLE
ncbi:ABC transporter substrate-binding protein [Paenibacillus nasutitermitis]|uniref:ABC transporter substrate-binding protein n=1 Tax=Paenibacillus nasutitermitis TaxID=1652958 RepID=A0A916ZL99_9BACL|nr:extracellular solute-binding protein [Paenibacillus nasutitermitis]GGE02078.1 ABC transporter substrate-binding protein [Paenibacillus nasutitermitis]